MLTTLHRGWPALILLIGLASAANADYVADVQKWRDDFDADVRTGGWLTLIGRFRVDEGMMTVGSDASSAAMLPPALAGKRVGTLVRHGDEMQFNPEQGFTATVDDQPLTQSTTLSTKPGAGRILSGNLRMAVRAVGDDYYLLVSDLKNPAIQKFAGTTWFPIDAAYQMTATFVAYDKPEVRYIPMTHVDSREQHTSTGEVVFQIGGKTARLRTFLDDDKLFVMFQDQTNGHETYGGGRFLTAPLPKDGKTVLDFNKAFNPYCSVNSYVLCPIPPPENRLSVEIPAGETISASE